VIDGPLITVDRVIALHQALCSAVTSDAAGACLEQAVGTAVTNALYASEEGEPDLLIAACYLARGLSTGQCFMDGNKRVAWAAFLDVLMAHGELMLDVETDGDDAASHMADLSTNSMSVSTFARWAAGHLTPL